MKNNTINANHTDSWQSIQQQCQQALEHFEAGLNQVEQQQRDLLKNIIDSNRDSDFGRAHGFADIADYQGFAERVPIATYEAFQTDIAAIAAGKQQVLTTAPVIQFEETSGSSSGAKLIPYTAEGLTAFQRAILPWLGDLLRHRPKIMRGRLFFMISPALRPPTVTEGGIAIGAGNDLAYFGENLAAHLGKVTLWSPALVQPQSPEQWKTQVALLLLQAPDLSLLSLWSPTLLLEIVDYIVAHKASLLEDIADDSRRALLSVAIGERALDTQAIWPQLDTISCWDSHTSAVHAQTVQQRFPHANLQGKGILSTEAVVSLPFSQAPAPILAANSHFYEFLDDDNQTLLAQQLQVGQRYRIIVTTQSGLYRYDTGDRVEVVGYYQQTPALKFIGRQGLASDLCGEKLTEAFVAQAIATVDEALLGQSLLQAVNAAKPHYCWVIATPNATEKPAEDLAKKLIELSERLEENLCRNPQYQYARVMGQLGELQVKTVADIQRYYQQQQHSRGKSQRLGTMKLPSLLAL